MTDETKVEVTEEEAVEAEVHQVEEGSDVPFEPITDDIRVLNERLGYPIGEAEEAEGGEPEVEPTVDDDSAVPSEANTVAEIKEYLDSEGVEYTSSQTKAELLDLVNS